MTSVNSRIPVICALLVPSGSRSPIVKPERLLCTGTGECVCDRSTVRFAAVIRLCSTSFVVDFSASLPAAVASLLRCSDCFNIASGCEFRGERLRSAGTIPRFLWIYLQSCRKNFIRLVVNDFEILSNTQIVYPRDKNIFSGTGISCKLRHLNIQQLYNATHNTKHSYTNAKSRLLHQLWMPE